MIFTRSVCLREFESIGDDDSIQIRTLERVSLDDIELDENGQITATASIRPEVDDLPLEEEKQTFTNLRNSLLKFVQNYQWGYLGKKLHYPEKEYL